MARKGLLAARLDQTLSGGETAPETTEAPDTSPAPRSVQPRSGSPTVKRFKQTFDELRSESIQEIDPSLIGPGPYRDRFDASAEIDGLVASIRESGQRLPVLLRRAPEGGEFEYEPVYGRRRIAACRRIGIPVRAFFAEMDDEELVVAQGLENSERLDNSYIEKAVFIVQLRDAGFAAQLISRALMVPAAEISRMTNVVRGIPEELVYKIGPAHGIGRRQWLSLATAVKSIDKRRIQPVLREIEELPSSDDRFKRALNRLTKSGNVAPKTQETVTLAAGQLTVTKRAQRVEVKVASKDDSAFVQWLTERSEELYHQWKTETDTGN